eukprot:Sspe_Gene.77109::Locus_48160_Transcript_1_1_Confidence_1.000_Length_495::g.77109::m.77109
MPRASILLLLAAAAVAAGTANKTEDMCGVANFGAPYNISLESTRQPREDGKDLIVHASWLGCRLNATEFTIGYSRPPSRPNVGVVRLTRSTEANCTIPAKSFSAILTKPLPGDVLKATMLLLELPPGHPYVAWHLRGW